MQIQGSYTFEYDQQAVWNILMNPDAIAKAIPGVKEMVPLEGETYAWRAIAKIGVASVSGTYSGIIRMTEIEAPDRYRLTAEGEGQQSVINGTALITMQPAQEAGKTVVVWDAEASLAGKLASIAQRLIKSAAGLLSRQFFGGLAKQLKAAEKEAKTVPAATSSHSMAGES
ncbi:MAG: carbon monoxide dehydrogenase subunit G [Chloroflexaceae bacterium]|nr:carbon monoxide dehydrogenase subunit G [Chloroflexaceae bacterium]NJL34560.1 carbon monoxide dehydrogenase subunit G [Chloroflexaceae bacterium]NJO07236.1 carbon monoxide dehydrogenase subunit G [Chloroflexaceae bacterium]